MAAGVAFCAKLAGLVTCGAADAEAPPRFVTEWGEHGSGPAQLQFPRGMDVDSQGRLFLADTRNHRVQIFDRAGSYLGGWGSQGSAPGQFLSPLGIAVDDEGHVYVTDSGNYRVQKFRTDGTFVLEWGVLGGGNGEFMQVHAIDVDVDGDVYVTDSARIQRFTSTGDFVLAFGNTPGAGQLSAPRGIVIGPGGNVFVSDLGSVQGVMKFTRTGQFLTRWGGSGEIPGAFQTPIGIDTDSQGNVYVVDHHNFRMQKFTNDGVFLSEWGTQGRDDGQFVGPHDIAIDDRDDIYVVDFGNDALVQQWTYRPVAVQNTSWGAVKRLFRAPTPPPR